MLVPIHAPHVKLLRPAGGESPDWRARGGPDWTAALRPAPRDVGEQHAAVVLHDVDLAVIRPRLRGPDRPERGPQARARVDARAHLKTAIREAVQAAR